MLLRHCAGVSAGGYISGTFTLPSADEERIGKYHTADTAWTLCLLHKHR